MTSRAAHALLRAYVAHPFAAFPASAYASTALAAFSATGHALLPNSPPRDSIGRFRGGGYLQVRDKSESAVTLQVQWRIGEILIGFNL